MTTSALVLRDKNSWLSRLAANACLRSTSFGLAREIGPDGITINVIVPGLIATAHVLNMFGTEPEGQKALTDFFAGHIEQQAVKRRGMPEDIARAILFLTEEGSGFISGQMLNVDGGAQFI